MLSADKLCRFSVSIRILILLTDLVQSKRNMFKSKHLSMLLVLGRKNSDLTAGTSINVERQKKFDKL